MTDWRFKVSPSQHSVSDLQVRLFGPRKPSRHLHNQLRPPRCPRGDDWGSISPPNLRRRPTSDQTIENNWLATPSSQASTDHRLRTPARARECSRYWRGSPARQSTPPPAVRSHTNNLSVSLTLRQRRMKAILNCEHFQFELFSLDRIVTLAQSGQPICEECEQENSFKLNLK